ncbi:MAG: UvrD-helicase domain-containing protein [Methanobacteriaceae archaeon]
MISYDYFERIVTGKLKRDISRNSEQKKAIKSPQNKSLFIVAGPGAGKTTVMVLKILKFIFVDEVHPNEILATTFTKKAAEEIHSRILSWGDEIKQEILKNNTLELSGEYLKENSNIDVSNIEDQFKVAKVDFSQIATGTIDSIAEEVLRLNREPGTNMSVVIEDFIANTVMVNSGLLKNNRYLNKDLQEYLGEIIARKKLDNPSKMSEILLATKDHLYYDQVDFTELMNGQEENGGRLSLMAIKDYIEELNKLNALDFTMLEDKLLKKLDSGKLDNFLNGIKIILVDEYQDTNLLQEKIYFKLSESAIRNNGCLTVVGDDDQSLYRFRGATVNLFTNFVNRLNKKLGIDIETINLSQNYRSTDSIIDLCNHFVEIDEEYQGVRVEEKPKIEGARIGEHVDIPVLGMFRNNTQTLANDLSRLLSKLVNNKEVDVGVKAVLKINSKTNNYEKHDCKDIVAKINYTTANNLKKYEDEYIDENTDISDISNNNNNNNNNTNLNNKFNNTFKIELSNKGKASDVAILTYSPKESNKGDKLLPHYIRKSLASSKNPIEVFNPRGKDLPSVEQVKIFCGLILECIDPNSFYQKQMDNIPKLAEINLKKWRRIAKDYIENYDNSQYNDNNKGNENNNNNKDGSERVEMGKGAGDYESKVNISIKLEEFVESWSKRDPIGHSEWPRESSLMKLAYKLSTWIPEFQNDAEGLVYLTVIAQTINQVAFFNKYSGNIIYDKNDVKSEKLSIQEAIWNIFIPIATGAVSIDENLLGDLPDDKINIMSIHQSKGLEFPLVVVDVGSRFKKNHSKNSFLRFPKKGDKSSVLEDKIRPFSPIGKGNREGVDRVFDDLTRLYFVAFSRAQDVLILIGLNSCIEGYVINDKVRYIPNVALGWKRDEAFVGFKEILLI